MAQWQGEHSRKFVSFGKKLQVGLKIGEGSFAQVRKGSNVVNGQDVAIKMVKSEKEMCLEDVGVSYEDVLKAMHSEVKTSFCAFSRTPPVPCFRSSPQLLPPIPPPFLARFLHDADFFCLR